MGSVWLVFYDSDFHSVCPLTDKDKRLMEASWWERLTVGQTGFRYDRAMLSKSLIQFFIDGQGCVPSLLFDLRPNYAGDNEDNGDLLQKFPCSHCHSQCPPTLQQKYNWFFCVLILYSVSMIILFHVPSKKNIFISSIPICILFISLSCLIALIMTCST